MIFEYDIDELEDALIDGSIMCECCGDVIELTGIVTGKQIGRAPV